MGIVIKRDLVNVKPEELNALYKKEKNYYKLFEKSFLKAFAFEGDTLKGAVRVISEGVETALLVDLEANGYDSFQIKKLLLEEIEKDLIDRRVMVYSSKENLELLEETGYGRCKNAWTYFKEGLKESDFLPAGYKYENEYFKYSSPAINEPKKAEIVYKEGTSDTTFEEINTLLTNAFFGRPHDVNKTKEAFLNSQYVVTAYDGKKLVGMARAVSDCDAYATILNVSVDPTYQGLSIGKKVVLKLSEITNADVIVLNTHPGAIGFYNRIKEYRRNRYVFEKHITTNQNMKMDQERMSAMFTPKGYKFPDEY